MTIYDILFKPNSFLLQLPYYHVREIYMNVLIDKPAEYIFSFMYKCASRNDIMISLQIQIF